MKHFRNGKPVHEKIYNRTRYNMSRYYLDLFDAFKEAVSALSQYADDDLRKAWNYEDFHEYIPDAYMPIKK